jgi:transcription antitermination factor NusG
MSGSYGVTEASEVREPGTLTPPSSGVFAPRQWFAIQTRYRFEKSVTAQLNQKGLDAYLPLRTGHHSWSDRQTIVTIPLFPGYAFVDIDQSRLTRQAVLQTAGLIGFVSFGGTVAAIPAKQIEDLRLLLQQKVPFSLHGFVHVGQRVRIRGGCLHGLEGVLLQHEKEKLVISIESIQRSLAVELKGYELDLI